MLLTDTPVFFPEQRSLCICLSVCAPPKYHFHRKIISFLNSIFQYLSKDKALLLDFISWVVNAFSGSKPAVQSKLTHAGLVLWPLQWGLQAQYNTNLPQLLSHNILMLSDYNIIQDIPLCLGTMNKVYRIPLLSLICFEGEAVRSHLWRDRLWINILIFAVTICCGFQWSAVVCNKCSLLSQSDCDDFVLNALRGNK